MVVQPLMPEFCEAEAAFEFEVSLVYIKNFRPARATLSHPVSKNQKEMKERKHGIVTRKEILLDQQSEIQNPDSDNNYMISLCPIDLPKPFNRRKQNHLSKYC